ncbi:MAG: ATP-binding protein [Solirubrobacterales bacterium]
MVVEALSESRVVCLLGARQSGKSTLVRSIARDEHRARYLTLDAPEALDAARSDPTGFVASEEPMVIDEVQRAPDLLLAIKRAVDEDPRRGRFLLTGSANILSLPQIADALPGRVDYLTLWPFSQGELLGREETFLERVFAGRPPQPTGAPIGRPGYAERIARGGFPEAVNATPSRRLRFFSGYIDSILGREVDGISSVRDVEAVGRLLRLVAARTASLTNLSALGRDLGVDHKTAAAYLRVLEQLFLVLRLPAWHTNLGHRVAKTPKLHLADTGMLMSLLGADPGRLESDGGIAGSAFETFVVDELTRQASFSPLAPLAKFNHYRDQRGNEVDLVVELHSGEVVGVEVKASATPRAADTSGLKLLRDRLGERFRCGVLIHTGPDTVPIGDRIWAVPLEGLLA